MAIETLSSQQSAAWKDRVLPPVEKVAEGVWALPVPIPNNPLVYTYCYAIADGTGVVLIDPGWDGKDQYLALTSALADLGFKVADIHGLAITHYHRDHIGLAPALLAKNPDAWIAMHGEDLRAIKRFYTNAVDLGTGSGALALFEDILTRFGPDSFIGRTASVLMGSTETTFYTIALYFGATKVRNTRHCLPAALLADLAGICLSAAAVGLFLGR